LLDRGDHHQLASGRSGESTRPAWIRAAVQDLSRPTAVISRLPWPVRPALAVE
jgi:hypothetical protein